ncbi:MAG: hypothetical protein K0S05_2110 [Agromyces sp.]|nr:hypothetical protein [Agromyces sp.]
MARLPMRNTAPWAARDDISNDSGACSRVSTLTWATPSSMSGTVGGFRFVSMSAEYHPAATPGQMSR